MRGKRCSSVHGFSLHANRYISSKDRGALEKLLAYGARGPFSNQRLSLLDAEQISGELVYTLKATWKDGTEALLLSPAELTEKLVALIPPPYVHLSRYFGVLASHSKVRPLIVLRPDVKKGFTVAPGSPDPVRTTWAWLLARVKSFPEPSLLALVLDAARAYISGSIGESPMALTRHLKEQLAASEEDISAALEVLCREGLLARLTSRGVAYGEILIGDGYCEDEVALLRDYPLRKSESMAKLEAMKVYAAATSEQRRLFLDDYFRR